MVTHRVTTFLENIMNADIWTWTHAFAYGILTTLFILLYFIYVGWLLKHNYKNTWKIYVRKIKDRKNLKFTIIGVPLIVGIASYRNSGPFDLSDIEMISLGVSTAALINVYYTEKNVNHRLSILKLLAFWIATTFPFMFILWFSGLFFEYWIAILFNGGKL